jgi:hypothetical protein
VVRCCDHRIRKDIHESIRFSFDNLCSLDGDHPAGCAKYIFDATLAPLDMSSPKNSRIAPKMLISPNAIAIPRVPNREPPELPAADDPAAPDALLDGAAAPGIPADGASVLPVVAPNGL